MVTCKHKHYFSCNSNLFTAEFLSRAYQPPGDELVRVERDQEHLGVYPGFGLGCNALANMVFPMARQGWLLLSLAVRNQFEMSFFSAMPI